MEHVAVDRERDGQVRAHLGGLEDVVDRRPERIDDHGGSARTWLVEAAAAGTSRVKVKMAEAVTLARLHGSERIDRALGHAAMFARFAEGDLASILDANPPGQHRRADDVHSLQTSTDARHQLGGQS